MIRLECDYACGAADVVMRALIETNSEQHCGYSEDEICDRARKLILEVLLGTNGEVASRFCGTESDQFGALVSLESISHFAISL